MWITPGEWERSVGVKSPTSNHQKPSKKAVRGNFPGKELPPNSGQTHTIFA